MDVTLSARLNVPPLTRWIFVPDRLNVIGELQSLTVLNEMEFTAADKIHGLFAAVLAVFLISLVIRSMPILPLWVMPSLVVASNHPFTPCKNGMAIIAATIPNSVITIIISMSVKPLLLFMGELPLHRKSPHLNPLSFRERARVRVGFRIYPQLQP